MGYSTFLDHVYVSVNINQCASDLTVIDNKANISDHIAIVFTLHIAEGLHVHFARDEGKQNVQNCHVFWSERKKQSDYETTGVLLELFE